MTTASTSKGLRVAVYVRVSTRDQRERMQHDETRRYARARGWQIVEVYEDEPASGASSRRLVERTRMLADAKRRRFDGVLVYSLSRFSRSLKDAIVTIADLDAYGCEFASCTEPFDASPTGRLTRGLCAVFAAYEREVLLERTHAGIQAAKARGVRFGRPRIWVNLVQITKMRKAGISGRNIATKLKVDPSVVFRAFKRLDATPPAAGPSPVMRSPKRATPAPSEKGAGHRKARARVSF